MDENNEGVSVSWIVFRHGIVAKLTSAVEFSTAEDLAITKTSSPACKQYGRHGTNRK